MSAPDASSGPARTPEATGVNGFAFATPEKHGYFDTTAGAEAKGTNSESDGAGGLDSPLLRKALQFLSTATPGTLGAIAVGLVAVTYLILGRFGLLVIGALGGAVGFVVWEARNPDVARAVRGEKGPDILERVWRDFKNSGTGSPRIDNADDEDEHAAIRSFDDFRPETRDALGGLVDAVIRDYVKWWYSPIIPFDHSFPLACRKTLTSFLLAISNHLYRKRPADAYLDLLTNSSSILIVFMSELAAAFAELPPDSNKTAADTVYNYLATNPDSRLANLLNQRQQAAKFKTVAEDLLRFLDQNSHNCDPARIFLREILANSVLETTLQQCSKAEWINGWIVYLLEAGEPDLSQAIDVGMQSGRESHNVFADMDGNIGNVSVAKPSTRSPVEAERSRRTPSLAHKKKLSKADEELEEAMEEMKRMNAMIAKDDARRRRESVTIENPEQLKHSLERTSDEGKESGKSMTAEAPASASGHSADKSSPRGTSTDGVSSRGDTVQTPVTPRSVLESSSQSSSPKHSRDSQFTNFDQIMPHGQGDGTDEEALPKAPLTLHNASFTLHDDTAGDKTKIRNKPTWDYLIQVEPQSADYPGWMIVRRYSDFETLHEILRRIATISGATAFTELHKELPSWKIHTRESLRGELERYLRDACWYQTLAESEGTKRFLEKSQSHTHGSAKTFGWDAVRGNMLDVLTSAPKGAMDGGRTLVGGVSGMFGNIPGLGKKSTNQSVDLTPNSNRLSISTPPRMEPMMSPARSERTSLDSQRSSVVSTQPGKMAPMDRRPSHQSQGEPEGENAKRGRLERNDSYMSVSVSGRPSREHSRASSLAAARSPSMTSLDQARLPPPPDDMPDDYGSPTGGEEPRRSLSEGIHMRSNGRSGSLPPGTVGISGSANGTKKILVRQFTQLTESETRVAVELLFAVINEMYTLSSAWNIRRTLLTAAKSFLLRPGNPSLVTVQSLMQSSVLDGNTSDAGLAAHLRKLRENTMPTDQERAAWPAELTADEKEKLAAKARKMLIQSGVPAALMGVMGQAATGEALGRVFDCLQVEEVARGLLFGLMLQAVRVVTH